MCSIFFVSYRHSPEPSLYIKSETDQFSRSSVEAAPDSLVKASFTPFGPRKSLPLTRSNLEVSQFYRGNIESGALPYQQSTLQYSNNPHKSEALQYYGAAKWHNSVETHDQEVSITANEGERYYGAASQQYRDKFVPLATGQVYHPVRESVESRPHLMERARFIDIDFDAKKDMSDLRQFYLSEHGKKFRQSRPNGHSLKEKRVVNQALCKYTG